ncbi:TfpX/TfpZ family type IV pilin accessory protein [Acinetobacter sp.]|uniref:TfpX/TfpZ family type IV pilin accessory protein n=1 Tax=Acinetobacter sp. TaxID=472 RepID=UPI002FC706C0
MTLGFKDKFKAASLHLLISCVLAFFCFIVVFFVLYPSSLAQATGVSALFLIMLGVDVVLGPMLTFIVYKKYKKTLKMDLLVIAIIQLSALLYGGYAMHQGRPVWIAYTADRFELVRANEIVEESQDYPVSLFIPQYIFVDTQPKTAKEQISMMLEEVQSNISPAQQPKYYRPFSQAKFDIQTKSKELEDLNHYNTAIAVEQVLKKYPEATAWLPLKASAMDMVVLVNKQQGKVIKIVNLRPWQ